MIFGIIKTIAVSVGLAWFVATYMWVVVFVTVNWGCRHPLPGPRFPWYRCLPPCQWCDYIAAWDQQKHEGPYR